MQIKCPHCKKTIIDGQSKKIEAIQFWFQNYKKISNKRIVYILKNKFNVCERTIYNYLKFAENYCKGIDF